MNGDHALAAPANVLPPRLTAAIFLAAGAVLLAATALASQPAAAAAWGGAALAVWCGVLLATCSAVAHRDGLGLAEWKTGSWFLLLSAAACGLDSMTWAHPQTGLTAQIVPSSVARAEFLTAVALTAWAAGYCAGPRKLAVEQTRRFIGRLGDRHTSLVRSPVTPWLLYGAGTAARIASAALSGHFGYVGNPASAVVSASWYQQALTDAALACPLAIGVAALRMFREKAPGARLTLAILLAAEFASVAVSGFKAGFITTAVAVAIPRASAGYRIPAFLIAAIAGFLLLVVIPFTSAYRSEVRSGTGNLTTSEALAAAPGTGSAAVTGITGARLPSSLNYVMQRAQVIDPAAIVAQDTPSRVPYASAAQLPEGMAAGLIPRVLWPGKPLVTTGYQFSQEYYGTAPGEYTSAAVTTEADLYQHGGWTPLLVGLAILGCLMRVTDDVLDVRASVYSALLIVLVCPILASPEGDITSILPGMPGILLVWLAVVAAAFPRRQRPGRIRPYLQPRGGGLAGGHEG
jgi:hypothetical protein